MTISPPANVKLTPGEPARILASGFDTLVLFVQVLWGSESFLERLGKAKVQAETYEVPCPDMISLADGGHAWVFNVQPHGSRGYAYLLVGHDLTMKVGNWLTPRQRPSIMVELRSEYLWTVGPETAVARVRSLIEGAGGRVEGMGISRADACVDVLVPDDVWSDELAALFVTRASDVSQHKRHGLLTGFSIGKGKISARLYDKPLEIAVRSNKVWMHDVWGLAAVPDGHRIIRVEFQLRREVLKELGIESPADLFRLHGKLWAYCTQKWLKVQDSPGKHHTQRSTLAWWSVVQAGFAGSQAAQPLVRAKAIRTDRLQLLNQIFGCLVSLLAVQSDGLELEDGRPIELDRQLVDLLDAAAEIDLTDDVLTDRVLRRLAEYRRALAKYESALCARRADLISSEGNRPPEGTS